METKDLVYEIVKALVDSPEEVKVTEVEGENISVIEIYITTIPGGVILGLIWGLIEIADNRIISKKTKSFGIFVLSRTLIYTILFIIIAFFASWLGSGSLELAKSYITSTFIMVNFVLFTITAFLFVFFKQMNRKFGPGILFQYITGKYFNPKEENRIFISPSY